MSEAVTETKGKKKKLKKWQIGAIVVASGIVAYIGYEHYEAAAAANAATTSTDSTDEPGTDSTDEPGGDDGASAIDPSTDQPYSDEIGANAIDPATGETYASELLDDTNEITTWTGDIAAGINPVTGDPLPTSVSPTSPDGSIPTSGGAALATWKNDAIASLMKDGLSTTEAAQAVNEYLSNKSITGSLGAAAALQRLATATPAPTATPLAPITVAAKNGSSTQSVAAATSALTTTEKNLAADKKAEAANPSAKNAAAVKSLTAREAALKKS